MCHDFVVRTICSSAPGAPTSNTTWRSTAGTAWSIPGSPKGFWPCRPQGLRLACLTNKPTAFARPLLRAKGLEGFFSHVFGGDAFARKKPDPLPLLKTCDALGSEPARTLMLGDSSNDALAARAAGCPVVLVSYGYNHGHPVRSVDADGYLDSLDGLAAWLGQRR